MNNKPNLLFIMCDQQRLDCLGYSGIRPVKTPNIDSIAKDGTWFRNAYTPIPVCAPARQALFSGRRPETYGALWNFDIVFPVGQIPEGSYSWTKQIHDSGYSTAFLGKWNVSNTRKPAEFGFDEAVSDSDIMSRISKKYPSQDYPNGFFGDPSPVALEDSHTHQLAGEASSLIRTYSTADKPWYVHVDFQEPHLPCRPSAPFCDMYSPADIPEWGGFRDGFINKPYIHKQQIINWELEDKPWSEWARTVALYYGMISQMDDAIGRILKTLRESGQEDNTIVVFTCDHGDLCGSHNMIDKHYVMFEDLTHIPLIIKYPQKLGSKDYEGYVHNCIDLPPTLLELMSLTPPEEAKLQGENLVPVLTGEDGALARDYAVSTYNGQQFGLYCTRAIKNGRYKYVWNLTDIDELYDLDSDPYELDNRIYDKSLTGELESLRRKLYDELARCDDKIVGWTSKQLLDGKKI